MMPRGNNSESQDLLDTAMMNQPFNPIALAFLPED
jgi:hypothetical protein